MVIKLKKVLLVLLLVLLCGCQSNLDALDIQQSLIEAFDEANSLPTAQADNKKVFYSFYLEPEVGRLKSNETSSILKYKETKFAMNLNIAKIVNAQNYGDIIPSTIKLNDELLVATVNGEYSDFDNSIYPYQSYIYQLSDDEYYLTIDTQYVFFSALGNAKQIIDVVKPIMKIARSIEINSDAIMLEYSAKERITFEGEELSLYDEIIPTEGRVSDMINKNNQNTEIDTNNPSTPGEENISDIIPSDEEYRTDNLE